MTGFDLVKCEDPGTPNYGYRIRDEGHYTETVVLYSCNPGYTMHGSNIITCLSGDRRVWDKPLPTCIGNNKNSQYKFNFCLWISIAVFLNV